MQRKSKKESTTKSKVSPDPPAVSLKSSDYANFGLHHDLGTLTRMLGTIHLEPLEVQAKYADQICRELVDTNDERLKSSLEESRDLFVEDEWNFCYWNTTAVGNAAYAALNGKNENVAQIARDLLERYKAWRQKRQWEQRMSYGIKFVTTLVLIAVLLFAVR